jgi:hypothetical protein
LRHSPRLASHLGPAIDTPPGARMLAEMLGATYSPWEKGLFETGPAYELPCP